mmetsp:Transcript_29707/g.62549  ORF Transcript_29707/g.62549 Transcript_29707/m.62549 type:complete len:892 (+) Transcript_29707:63-2738(+)
MAKLNTAYSSSAIFRKVHPHCVKDLDLQSHPAIATNTHASALLRLEDSPSDDGGGVVVPLRLIRTGQKEEIADDEHISDAETINIHPLLLQVLSRPLAQQQRKRSKASDDNNDSSQNDANQPDASRHPVMVASYDGLKCGMGWLEQVNIKNAYDTAVNKDECQCQVTIHLTYICSNTSRGRRYFSKTSNIDDNGRKEGIDLLKQVLTGEVVAENGILGVSLEEKECVDVTSEFEDDEHHDAVFFMVGKILINDESSVEKSANILHLGTHGSFEISLNSPGTFESSKSESNPHPSTPQHNLQPSKPEYNGIQSCPGYESILEELLMLAKMNDPNGSPTAVVLSGCSGVGKTRMASWFQEMLSRDLGSCGKTVDVSTISAKDILLEEAISSFDQSKVFSESKNTKGSHRLLLIDDLDDVVGMADETGSSSVVSNLESEQLRALNAIVKLVDTAINDVSIRCFVLGIARASWAQLPVQLARVGRFEKAITMSPPTLGQRREIFKFWLSTLPMSSIDRDSTITQWADLLAPRTAGCVAADIRRICADALTTAASRAPETCLGSDVNEIDVIWDDVKEAARTCVPSQLSSMDVIPSSLADNLGNSGKPIDARQEFEMAWKDFGGYDEEKKRLYRTVVRPWKYHIMESATVSHDEHDAQVSSVGATLGISKPSGVLFHGPPGVGKTFAAMCLASSLGLHCVKVRASEVFNQWLGGSEATLRSIFSRARAASPCILFFDELDALATNREGGDSDTTSGVQSRILTTLLNEMDGITNAGGKQGVLVVAATNRLNAIDAALLRPGRLEEHVFLSHPKSPCIQDILRIQTAKMPLHDSVDFAKLGNRLQAAQASCAEIEGICRDACLIAMRRCSLDGVIGDLSVVGSDFDQAFRRIKKNAN